jgi:hypothetical protein
MTRHDSLVQNAKSVVIKRIMRTATIAYRDGKTVRLYDRPKSDLNMLALACARAGLWPKGSIRCLETWVPK